MYRQQILLVSTYILGRYFSHFTMFLSFLVFDFLYNFFLIIYEQFLSNLSTCLIL